MALGLLSACASPTAFLRSSPVTTPTTLATPTSTATPGSSDDDGPSPALSPSATRGPTRSASPTAGVPSAAPATASSTSSATATQTPTRLPQPIEVAGCPFPAATPITAAPGDGKTVALTFDDGAGPFTSQILGVLEQFHVQATFFDTGLHDGDDPQDAREVIAAGDEVGNHTYHHFENWGFHAYFTPAQQRQELTSTNAVLKPLIGHDPCVMRPPGGAYDAASLALVRSLGMSLVLWTTDAEDWRQPPVLSSASQQEIIHNAEQGGDLEHPIVLLHAAKASHEPDCGPTVCAPGEVSAFRGNTVAALPAIIRFYLARGYTFVTL